MMTSVRVFLATFALVVCASSLHAQNPAIGSWDFTAFSQDGPFKSVLVVSEEAGKLKAVDKAPEGELLPYSSIVVDGNKITLVITVTYQGSPLEITFKGQIDRTTMGGDADYGGQSTGTWSATRK